MCATGGDVLLYVSTPDGVQPVEVARDGRVDDVLRALSLAAGTVLSFQGEDLPLGALLSDVGIGSQATLHATVSRIAEWDPARCTPQLSLPSPNVVAGCNDETYGAVLAKTPGLTSGVHQWRVVLSARHEDSDDCYHAGVCTTGFDIAQEPTGRSVEAGWGSSHTVQLAGHGSCWCAAGTRRTGTCFDVVDASEGWEFTLDFMRGARELRARRINGEGVATSETETVTFHLGGALADEPLLPFAALEGNGSSLRIEPV